MSDPSELTIFGVFNFRDLAKSAPQIRAGVVYRSDGLHRTDAAGADAIAATGIRRVIDLRTEQEHSTEGLFNHPAVETVPMPMVASNRELAGQFNTGVGDILRHHYGQMLRTNQVAIRDVLATIAASVRAGEPILFHCTAGKDRTGVVAALVLSLAGVDDETIAVDFGTSEAGVAKMADWYQSEKGQSQQDKADEMGIGPDAMAAMMEAKPASMRGVLADLVDEFGSVAAYISSTGLSETDQQTLASLSSR